MVNSKISVKQVDKQMVNSNLINKLQIAFPPESQNPQWNLKATLNLLKNDQNIFLLGFVNNDIAGFLYGHKLDRFDEKKEFLIYEISVSEKFRKIGVAKALINHLILQLKKQGFNEAWVLTNKSNKIAMKLYSSTGAVCENHDDVMFVYKIS